MSVSVSVLDRINHLNCEPVLMKLLDIGMPKTIYSFASLAVGWVI